MNGGGKVDNDKYYKSLGLNKNCSKSDVKKAYRKLAMIHHPDKGGSEDKFKEITKAFETLSDDNKRKQYDQFGEEDGSGLRPGGDIFSQMFSGGMQQNSNKKGNNVIHEVNLSLKEIYNGKTINVTINRKTIDFDSINICSQCNGQGMMVQTVQMGPMIQQIQQPCLQCNGQGKSFNINHIAENIKVSIPKGAPDNHKITIFEKGDDIVDGDTGDLIVVVKEIKDDIYIRRGYDLFVNKDISLLEALKGFKIELNTLDDRNILITNDKIIKPNNVDVFSEKCEWKSIQCGTYVEPFAKAKISDEIKVKELIESGQLKDENITAFIIDGKETYFYKNTIDELLKSKKPSNSVLYYKSNSDKSIHCIEEEGMPYYNSPMLKGDLYMTFNIIFPEKVTVDNDILIKGGFDKPINNSTINEIESDIEVYELIEKNPDVSYNSYKDTVKEDVEEEQPNHMHQGNMQQCSQQ